MGIGSVEITLSPRNSADDLHHIFDIEIPAAATLQVTKNTTFEPDIEMFDNYHVQHGLPRNHANYSWIQKSVVRPHIPVGLPTASHALQFITASDFGSVMYRHADALKMRAWGTSERRADSLPGAHANFRKAPGGWLPTDFVGLNTHIYEPVDTSTNTLGKPLSLPYVPEGTKILGITMLDGVNGDQDGDNVMLINNTFVNYTFPFQQDPNGHVVQVFNALLLHRQGPYGGPSWKQIRGGNHPIIREQKKNSQYSYILPDADELHLSTSMGHSVIRPRYGKLHFHDRVTPVTSKYLPLRTTVGVSTEVTNKFGKRHVLELPVDIQTPYGNELVYFNKDEITKELNLSKSKVAVYDEIKGMYTRGALETSVSPVTDIKKFEYSEIIWPRHQNMYMNDVRQKTEYSNNFWTGVQLDRVNAAAKTTHGQTTYGRHPTYSNDVIAAASQWPLDAPTGSFDKFPYHSSKVTYQARKARWGNPDWEWNFVGQGEGELVNGWSYPLKWRYGDFFGRFDRSGGSARMSLESGPLLAMPHQLHATSSIASPTQPPLVTCATSSTGHNPRGLKHTKDNPSRYTLGRLYKDCVDRAWDKQYSWIMQPWNDTGNWLGIVPVFGSLVHWQAAELAGTIKEINQITNSKQEALSTGVQSVVFSSQSSTPWYTDYDEFKNDVRVKAKDYSVIPEFRMEDHLTNYIKQKGGDFLAEQNSLFRMVGMPSGSTGQLAANSSEEQFYKVYGTTDFMKHFDILSNDIKEHYEPSTLTLQCNAYLKFNPYEGFYPASRTLQLANQLSASFGKHIEYHGPAMNNIQSVPNSIGKPTGGEQNSYTPQTRLAYRNFLAPLYAPGIMYNTIKAGIACDWPVMTTGSKIYKTRAGKSDYWALGYHNPERDQALLDRLATNYGGAGNNAAAKARVMKILKKYDSMQTGPYKIREEFRKDAIIASLVPLSASIGGYSDGLQISGVKQANGSYNPGFYTAKLNIKQLPGMQSPLTKATWAFATDNLGGVIKRIDITASIAPPENQGRWDKRIPFEAILNPAKYLANEPLFDYTPHPSASNAVTASWDGTGDNIYSMMTNNFLAAVPEFFLQGGNFTTIASRPQDELSLYAQAGSTYGMRIKMYRSLNRERSYNNERCAPLRSASYEVPQDPRDDHGLHETFTMYSRSSAFGYPIFGRVHSVRDENGTFTASDGSGGTQTYYTASLAIAMDLVEDYGSLTLKDIFAKTNKRGSGPSRGMGREYDAAGTQRINSTIFHTSSAVASTNGTLDSLEGYYWSYTPPYMHGEAWCDLIFKPAVSKVYSISEVLDSLTVVQRRIDPGMRFPTGSTGTREPQFVGEGYHSQSLYSAENVNENAMQLNSSLNLFGIGKVKTFAYSNVGQTGRTKATTVKRTVGESPAWIIQPKFETPMLNFSPLEADKGGTCPRPLTDEILRLPQWASASVPRGIWHQFGTLPQGNEGVWLEVGDIPKNWLDNHPEVEYTDKYAPLDATGSFALHRYKRKSMGNTMRSLVDFVGMDPTPRRLGEVRDQITVNEAVVAVPFVEKDNRRWFFTIDPHMVDVALGEESYRLSDNSDRPGNSIEEMIRKMDKYVFPPTLDFIRNRDLKAIAMYIFEFEMTFDKDDLSYIWQNLMPPSAKGFSTSTASVTHDLLANELMGYANKVSGKPMKDKVQWMVFKVKQRAPTNYYDKVIKATPELDRISTGNRSNQVVLGNNTNATYGFNWPYDHFSIIEMAQIKASTEFAELPEASGVQKIGSDGGVRSRKGQYSVPGVPGHGVRSPLNPGFGSAPGVAADSSAEGQFSQKELGLGQFDASNLNNLKYADTGKTATYRQATGKNLQDSLVNVNNQAAEMENLRFRQKVDTQQNFGTDDRSFENPYDRTGQGPFLPDVTETYDMSGMANFGITGGQNIANQTAVSSQILQATTTNTVQQAAGQFAATNALGSQNAVVNTTALAGLQGNPVSGYMASAMTSFKWY